MRSFAVRYLKKWLLVTGVTLAAWLALGIPLFLMNLFAWLLGLAPAPWVAIAEVLGL